MLVNYTITFISSSQNPPTVASNGRVSELSENYVLKLGDSVKTNESQVEVVGDNGFVGRFAANAEFSYEDEPFAGPTLIGIGRVFKQRLWSDLPHASQSGCWKYQTSCYVCNSAAYFEVTGEKEDTTYAIHRETVVWEYDETGARFDIVTIPPGYKATLQYDEAKPMRERYLVMDVLPITDSDYDRITNEFLNPRLWQHQLVKV